MLYESHVIETVCKYLKSKGYVINQKLETTEKGDDIVAVKNGQYLYIEAKGETSEKTTSNRFGQLFTPSQVRDHVSVALFKCAEVLTRERNKKNASVAIALPDNEHHRKCLSKINEAIKLLNVDIFWVSHDRKVLVESCK